ncbi:MAG: 4Fe-4S binding protein [Candidatus Hadarchaeales archaeon]
MLEDRMRVNGNLCMRCGACVSVCPLDAIEATDGQVMASDRCNDCGLCVKVCPVGAITVGKKRV